MHVFIEACSLAYILKITNEYDFYTLKMFI